MLPTQLGNHGSFWNFHAKVQTKACQNLSYFNQRCFAKIANLHQLIFVVCHKVANRSDGRELKAVVGSNLKSHLGDRHIEFGFESRINSAFALRLSMYLSSKLCVLNERVEVLAKNLRSFNHCHLRIN